MNSCSLGKPFQELRAHLKELADTEKRLYSQLQAADRVPTAADRFADG